MHSFKSVLYFDSGKVGTANYIQLEFSGCNTPLMPRMSLRSY